MNNLYSQSGIRCDRLVIMTSPIDPLDAALLRELRAFPRVGLLELSRRLGVARGTVQARLDRLQHRGVVTGFGPDLDLEALGYGVLAFSTLEIAQGADDKVLEHLRAIPEVLEVHVTTGNADLLCRIVARSNEDLHEVLQRVLGGPGVHRVSTQLALTTRLAPRLDELVDAAAGVTRRRRRASR